MKYQISNIKFQIKSKFPSTKIKVLTFKHFKFNPENYKIDDFVYCRGSSIFQPNTRFGEYRDWHLGFDICHYENALDLFADISRSER
jgi:hypothetical protein